MADTATFSAAMKTKLIGPIRDNLAKGKVLLFGDPDANPSDFKGILPSAEGIDFVGNEFRIPLKSKRNPAVGFRSENETLPAPGASQYTYISEPMRYAYALFNITGQLLKASASSEGAFKKAFKAEMDDTILSSKLDVNRAAQGDGSGVLALFRNNEAVGQTVLDVDTTINFRIGEIVDVVTVATGAVVGTNTGLNVTDVDRVNRTITVDVALATTGATATTDGLVRASSDSLSTDLNNSYAKEIQGLKSIVSNTGTLHGLSPSSYPWWKSYVNTTGGAVSDSILRDAKDNVGFEQGLDLNSDNLDFVMVTTRGLLRRYADNLTALKRFNDLQSTTLRGGFKVVLFDEEPIFVDDQVPVGRWYGLSLNRLFWAQMSDWEWMEEDGNVLAREPRKDRYVATLFKYCQLGTTHRGAHFVLTGLSDDVR